MITLKEPSTEVEALAKRLKEAGVSKLSIFPGNNPNATAEEVAKEINRALDSIEAGNA